MKKAVFLGAILAHPAFGLIFYESANPAANTEMAPTGVYANAGWQHQIVIDRESTRNLFFGTIISPKHFVTARHLEFGQAGTDARVFVTQPDYVTGTVEKVYTLRNATSPSSIQFDDDGTFANSDLYVYEIWETFPDFAELYSGTDEFRKEVVITGFGDSRGTAVNTTKGERGWRPDVTARKGRWGTNIVDGEAGSNAGPLLYCDFDAQGVTPPGDVLDPDDADATTHEVQAANKDSGGGWFIKQGGVWKLAGINYVVDTYGTVEGSTFNRWAIYDGVGLYNGDSTTPIQPCSIFGCDFYRRSHTYATRVSEHVTAINTVIQPAKDAALLSALGRFEVWAEGYGLASGVATDGDADKDGLGNLAEYLTESDPDDHGERNLPLTVDLTMAGSHTFTMIETLDLAGRGLATVLEVSDDLVQWDPVTGTTEDSNVVDSIAGTRTRELTKSFAGTGAVYYRLKITL
ncbi:MAG: hypothetical protein QNL33_19680 [Akkermansiaceae bacterium]|jgi:hypothetical protein